ncbi:hypothetical protein DFJ77DRAFT_533686 [Powellomyces hirtus]|nr:hypothetical protein DFJ77DRAFT_533686 [Powellomyces hirtus]
MENITNRTARAMENITNNTTPARRPLSTVQDVTPVTPPQCGTLQAVSAPDNGQPITPSNLSLHGIALTSPPGGPPVMPVTPTNTPGAQIRAFTGVPFNETHNYNRSLLKNGAKITRYMRTHNPFDSAKAARLAHLRARVAGCSIAPGTIANYNVTIDQWALFYDLSEWVSFLYDAEKTESTRNAEQEEATTQFLVGAEEDIELTAEDNVDLPTQVEDPNTGDLLEIPEKHRYHQETIKKLLRLARVLLMANCTAWAELSKEERRARFHQPMNLLLDLSHVDKTFNERVNAYKAVTHDDFRLMIKATWDTVKENPAKAASALRTIVAMCAMHGNGVRPSSIAEARGYKHGHVHSVLGYHHAGWKATSVTFGIRNADPTLLDRPSLKADVVYHFLKSVTVRNSAEILETTAAFFGDFDTCLATATFIMFFVRGMFVVDNPLTALRTCDFRLTEEAKKWPVLCQVDAKGNWVNDMQASVSSVNDGIKSSAYAAGLDPSVVTAKGFRKGFALHASGSGLALHEMRRALNHEADSNIATDVYLGRDVRTINTAAMITGRGPLHVSPPSISGSKEHRALAGTYKKLTQEELDKIYTANAEYLSLTEEWTELPSTSEKRKDIGKQRTNLKRKLRRSAETANRAGQSSHIVEDNRIAEIAGLEAAEDNPIAEVADLEEFIMHWITVMQNYKAASFQCLECHSADADIFASYEELHEHRVAVHGSQNICPVCIKSLASVSSFAKHMKVHTPFVRVQCEICWTVLDTKEKLERHHQLSHNTTRIACTMCEKKLLPDSMKKHMAKYHADLA